MTVITAVAVAFISEAPVRSLIVEAGLVLVGVTLGFVVLPDEPSRYWKVTARDLAATVPSSDLRAAGIETARALALQQRVDLVEQVVAVWSDALVATEHMLKAPESVVLDMNYRIVVTPTDQCQFVRTRISSTRMLPDVDEVWFSFCSDVSALAGEFAASRANGLSREIVERLPYESDEDWYRRVGMYQVSLVVSDQPIRELRRERVALGNSLVQRVVFNVADTTLADEFTPIQLSVEFAQGNDDRVFTVKFKTYHCFGSTSVSFEVEDDAVDISANEFMATSTGSTIPRVERGLSSVGVWFQTPRNALLKPGSGVLFSWVPGALLRPPPAELTDEPAVIPDRAPLPLAHQLPTELMPTLALDEPLVPLNTVTHLRLIDAYDNLKILPSRSLLVREGVRDRLQAAIGYLPDGFGLAVLDAWRSRDHQLQIVDAYPRRSDPSSQYVADPDAPSYRSPHLTGGAIDLTLTWRGIPMRLGSDFDEFTPAAHFDAFEGGDSVIRRLRRVLAHALLEAGFAPYHLEWWHWSYGDDVWALHHGEPHSLYDVVLAP